MKKSLCLFLCIYSFIPALAFGCFAPKPEQVVAPEILVKKAESIYLGEAIGASAKGIVDFKVVETLKGKKKNKIHIEAMLGTLKDTDFNKHEQVEFWQPSGGRMQIEPSCDINPHFEKGKKYLLVMGKPYHVKSFELILDKNDKWLKEVKGYLQAK
ncbi:MAG: hypothetical protein AAGB31_12680 [Bdellovibrio sp.]